MVVRVWAPRATRVEIGSAGQRYAAVPDGDDGIFVADLPLDPGDDYFFSLDGGPPLPDPRSAFQPHGVHGASRVVDPAAFAWSDAGFSPPSLAGGIIYEMHVGTFTAAGTFSAAIERLSHLADLGVTHVELMPVAAFAGTHGWGYDGVSLFAPHAPYGGPTGLRQFVDACHARGLGVIQDVVYNHLGPSGNYLNQFGPYFSDRYHTPWGQAVNLDGPGSDQVRAFFIDNALGWLRDYHMDGLRLDAVHTFLDTGPYPFLEELSGRVAALARDLGRPLVVIAESDLNDPRLVRDRQRGGDGLSAMWCDDLHHALHAVFTGERAGYYDDFGRIADIARAWSRGMAYDGRYSRYRGRRHGRSATDLRGGQSVVCLQNHDQVGNRPRGDRLHHVAGIARAKVGAALVLLSPFVPLLFQGEEWGASAPFPYFTNHSEPELGHAVGEGRRREFAAFGWRPETTPDPQAHATFLSAKLDWSEIGRPPHDDLLSWYRALIGLRRTSSFLAEDRLDQGHASFDEGRRWLLAERGPVWIACNLGDAPVEIPRAPGPAQSLLMASAPAAATATGIGLAPWSVALLGPGS
jgi:maltooligosyltrehalose trehalohydrolase